MPKFSFKCEKCSNDFYLICKALHINTAVCNVCSSSEVKRVYGFLGQNVERDVGETKDIIKKEANKIIEKIKSGDQNAISEIYGGST